MKAGMRSKLGLGIFFVIVVTLGMVLGGDVTVREGDLNVAGDLDVGDDVDAAYVGYYSYPYGYFDDVEADFVYGYYLDAPYVRATDQLACYGSMGISGFGLIGSYFVVGGKLTSCGGYDPPYVLYDRQARQDIIARVKSEVAPEKQAGAALFFNKETKRLEMYVPSEGKFYDLQGNVVYAMPSIEVPTTQYEPSYYLDDTTGEVRSWPKPAGDRYVIKAGFKLDGKTGQFISEATGQMVSKEEALEIYVATEGNFYSLKGNLLRSEPKEGEIQYVTEYYFDSRTGEVRCTRKPVQDR